MNSKKSNSGEHKHFANANVSGELKTFARKRKSIELLYYFLPISCFSMFLLGVLDQRFLNLFQNNFLVIILAILICH